MKVTRRVKRSIRERYRAHVVAHLRTATLWPTGTLFWGLATSVVILGKRYLADWMGTDCGTYVTCFRSTVAVAYSGRPLGR